MGLYPEIEPYRHGLLEVGTAWSLAHAWPGCELVVVDEVGHGSSDPDMVDALVAATDRFAKTVGSHGIRPATMR